MSVETKGRRLWVLPILIVASTLAAPASAQRDLDIERFRPALDDGGFLGMQGTSTPGHLKWNVGLWLNWSRQPLTLKVESAGSARTDDVVERRLAGDLLVQLGLGSRYAVAVDLPVVMWQDGEVDGLADGLGDLPVGAGGDPRILARARLVGAPAGDRGERREGFGLGLLAGVTLPVGSEEGFAAEEGATTDLTLGADFHVLGAGLGLNLGWRHRFDKVDLGTVRFRDELSFGLAIKVPIPVTSDLAAIVEVRGATDARSPFGDGPRTPVEGDLGVSWGFGALTLVGGIGTGFTDGVGAPSVRGILAIVWTASEDDADGDGVPDEEDECPHLPEDLDGFEDDDGCLDPDNDGDLVPDSDDRCPAEQADAYRDEDQDGCTDPFRDTDGVEIEDSVDGCPEELEDPDGFEDEDGCPDPDNDGDGVADAEDQCGDEAEDADGYEDGDGCSDPDNDGDGLPDAEDPCPEAAEDDDGHEDSDGCPDLDNDHDGVADAEDQCVDEPESINGRADADGCPDRGGRARWTVTREGGMEIVSGGVRFGAEGTLTRAMLRPGGAIDQLAQHLRGRLDAAWEIRFTSVTTERIGSLQRALSERGVSADRYSIAQDATIPPGVVHAVRAEETNSARGE